MLLLTSASDLVRVTTSASSDIEVHASWVDNLGGVITPGRTNTASITGTGDTTVVAAPAGSTQRNVKHLNIRNNHASTTCDVDVFHTDGTNAEELIRATLLAGETLTFDETGRWTHYDVNGGVYPATGQFATQAEMESGAATDKVVSPGRQHFHPSSAKFWVVFTGNTTTMLASYNMTSITDGTTEATVTIATDFATANWCCVATGEGTTSSAVANSRLATCRSIAVGTIIVFCIDGQATPVIQDPTRWHVCGFGDHA
jgi:hypothetical protein